MRHSCKACCFGFLQALERILVTFIVEMVFIAHVSNESFTPLEIAHILLDEITHLQKRLVLIRRRECHDAVDVRRIVALMLGGRRQRLCHCKRAAHDTSILTESILARNHLALLVETLPKFQNRLLFAASWTVQTHSQTRQIRKDHTHVDVIV